MGQREYAFCLDLPDFLSQSMMLQFDENNLSITYYLCAQLDPVDPADYANGPDKTSKLRADYALYLYRPEGIEEQKLERDVANPAGQVENP